MSFRRRLALWIYPEFSTVVSPEIGMEPTHLITLSTLYAAHIGRGLHTVAARVGVHSRAFTNLRDGVGCHVNTFKRAMDWFDQNWPADLEWPKSIPRPAKQKKEAA